MDVLVLATNRPDRASAFFDAWVGVASWDAAIVVEDGPTRSPIRRRAVDEHVCWADIPSAYAGIISRRDSAIKAFGCLLAAQRGATRLHVLDDDCLPVSSGRHDVCAHHRRNLTEGVVEPQAWQSSVPGLRVRGLPYGDRSRTVLPAMSVGLWTGVPDLDASTSLVQGTPTDFQPPRGTWLTGPQYVPICGMNLAFRRDILPLVYFAPMGEGQPVGRFDDIWLGLVAQRGLAHLGRRIAIGEPHVHHSRASDPLVNLQREATGVAAHEHLWRVIDAIPLSGRTPVDVALEIGAGLVAAAPAFPLVDLRPYVAHYGQALRGWARVTA